MYKINENTTKKCFLVKQTSSLNKRADVSKLRQKGKIRETQQKGYN
jgi:hypothetical protein